MEGVVNTVFDCSYFKNVRKEFLTGNLKNFWSLVLIDYIHLHFSPSVCLFHLLPLWADICDGGWGILGLFI